MAVLCEAMSVIIRCDSIEAYYAGGRRTFDTDIPNNTVCTDNELVRVGFMVPDHLVQYVETLQARGLQFDPPPAWWSLWNSNPLPLDPNFVRKVDDIVVVDQHRGSTSPCDWVEFRKLQFVSDGLTVSMCSFVGGKEISDGSEMAVPNGWTLEQAKSMRFQGPFEDAATKLEFLRKQDTLNVYRDIESGKEVFIPSHSSLPSNNP